MRAIWEKRAGERAKAERERLEKLNAIERAKLARGKMPHWSTWKKREIDGKLMAGPFSHILRPEQDATNASPTACGWNVASFRAARTYGFPRHELIAGQNDVRSFIVQGLQVSCPVCFEQVSLVDRILRENAQRAAVVTPLMHMAWNSRDRHAACGLPINASLLYHEFAHAITNDHRGFEACEVCFALFQVLWGPRRPENEFAIYTTNEEAAAARDGR